MATDLTAGAAVAPLYRDDSVAQGTLSRISAQSARAEKLVEVARARFAAITYESLTPTKDAAGAGEPVMPPFFSFLHARMDVIDQSLSQLEALVDRAGF